ncbi:unnamed protein product [Prorocentrum cordatum]|uniref:Uncharacterized protein n=1 Tax=Prorocentrum cordatum TaxID=2364126 RepID=A0ABN9XRP9_9DINO|nr:unnamed protein product [Polarella glacialis]
MMARGAAEESCPWRTSRDRRLARRRARDACERGLWRALHGRGDPPCRGAALAVLAEDVARRERLSRGVLASRVLGTKSVPGEVLIRNCSQHARDLPAKGAGLAQWRAAARGPRLGSGGPPTALAPDVLPDAGRWEVLHDDRLPFLATQARVERERSEGEGALGRGRSVWASLRDPPQPSGGIAAVASRAFGADGSIPIGQASADGEVFSAVGALDSGLSHASGCPSSAAAPSVLRADAPEFVPLAQKSSLCAEEAYHYPLKECFALPDGCPPFPRCTCGAMVFSGISDAALPPFVSLSGGGCQRHGCRGDAGGPGSSGICATPMTSTPSSASTRDCIHGAWCDSPTLYIPSSTGCKAAVWWLARMVIAERWLGCCSIFVERVPPPAALSSASGSGSSGADGGDPPERALPVLVWLETEGAFVDLTCRRAVSLFPRAGALGAVRRLLSDRGG